MTMFVFLLSRPPVNAWAAFLLAPDARSIAGSSLRTSYFEDEPARKDEAQRIAVNMGKPPELLRRT
jgi:hypothetical protein